MPAGSYNLLIEQGATFRLLLRWKNPDGTTIDLTGYTARAEIRNKVLSDPTTEVLYRFDTTPSGTEGTITIDELMGEIELYSSDEHTAAFGFKGGVWDLELVSPGGEVIRLLKGTVKVDREVTGT